MVWGIARHAAMRRPTGRKGRKWGILQGKVLTGVRLFLDLTGVF